MTEKQNSVSLPMQVCFILYFMYFTIFLPSFFFNILNSVKGIAENKKIQK